MSILYRNSCGTLVSYIRILLKMAQAMPACYKLFECWQVQ
jgi:hypothetical protein